MPDTDDDRLVKIRVGDLRVLEQYGERAIIAREEYMGQPVKLMKAVKTARELIRGKG